MALSGSLVHNGSSNFEYSWKQLEAYAINAPFCMLLQVNRRGGKGDEAGMAQGSHLPCPVKSTTI